MLMVNDRRHYADTFWFTMFHEIGHIMNGDYGITFEKSVGEAEDEADQYAQNMLIPKAEYDVFLEKTAVYNEEVIRSFSKKIGRDP